MTKHVVVVESPAKAKTIEKYLGPDYKVFASYGHVRDLEPKEGAVDTENDFAMRYVPLDKSSRHVDAIAKALENADVLLLATDPDREGEAISWHMHEILKSKKRAIRDKPVKRIAFNEITKTALKEAINNPREISMDLVNAQQARRALDFLVGFKLSPLLWKKIRRGLSAGRVQSPALRMIAEREAEIEAFEPKEYWTVDAETEAEKQKLVARLWQYQGKKVEQFSFTNETDAKAAVAHLDKSAGGKLTVTKVEKKKRKRNPAAPFTTSTLQQEAARKLGFTARRTMMVAQQLYEGIDFGDGNVGLISYMRTDSVSLSNDAVGELRELIAERYGEENLPKEPNTYKTKAKNAQEAHEAIRPTSCRYIPEKIKRHLSAEQLKLYNLIWMRTVACQMIHATLDMVAIELGCGEDNVFRVTGSTIAKPGFMAVYLEGQDDSKQSDADENLLPPLKEGDEVSLKQVATAQHFTEPPPRFTEASLVKSLEEHGIGRPSTYAAIIYTIQQREYVVLEAKRFKPTDLGIVVSRFLTNYFTQYVDYGFTANLEDQLDAVSRGEKEWVPLLKEFWTPFITLIKETDENVTRKDVAHEALDEKCPECDNDLSIRLGRRGRFVGCNNYPDCKYTRNMDGDESPSEPETVGRECPDCGGDLQYKHGRYGKFIGCGSYPGCKHVEPLEQPADTGVECPECHEANLLKRKSRRGKEFYSCKRYPDCKYAIWNEPVKEACPQCQWPIVTLKTTKRNGTEKVCPQKECDFSEKIEAPE